MQQQQQATFYNNSFSHHLPTTPDSAGILIANAGSAANERRGQKNIMNCFRDRTPSYTRSNSNLTRVNGLITNKPLNYRHEGVVLLKEPRPRPIKLTLLKSSSTRDLRKLYEMDLNNQTPNTPLSSASSTDLNKISTSSCSSSSNSSSYATNCSSTQCAKRLQKLELKLEDLQKQLQEQENTSKAMSLQMEDLSKKFEQLSKEQQEMQNKRKKTSSSMRLVKKDSTVGANQTTVQPSKLAAWLKLSNFWKQRPSIQTLKEQNIYNDEPCFDTEIELVLKDEVHKTVPKIVVDCCQLIEEKYRKSTEPIEGIYRQCGDYNKMQALRFSIDANDYMSLRQPNVDIHTLAGVLKLFLREIKSPLVSANEAKTFIGKPNQWLLTDLPNKLEILKRLIRSLPEINRDTMEYLFAHFNKLTKVPLQHISAETLSLSVTPSIFHTVQAGARIQDIHLLLKESEILADCVKIMIEYHQKIFECTSDRKNQRNRISVRNLKKTLSHPDLLFQNLF
ncbi:rho GTPase-activating protein 27 isoform X1 [Lucilia sericata]|uniref:rho GTPase-activating protein 27 isoform X1 n=1 Tax=Lucilia sericata TaxID=13632 RepID=UPI0018A820A7|nr:rho GTPase-activating protein 27 isoform X1 [Lucilia sericata]